MVDRKDPAFKNPTKPVGPFYTKEEVAELTSLKLMKTGYFMRTPVNVDGEARCGFTGPNWTFPIGRQLKDWPASRNHC
jgi:hypothetical protein